MATGKVGLFFPHLPMVVHALNLIVEVNMISWLIELLDDEQSTFAGTLVRMNQSPFFFHLTARLLPARVTVRRVANFCLQRRVQWSRGVVEHLQSIVAQSALQQEEGKMDNDKKKKKKDQNRSNYTEKIRHHRKKDNVLWWINRHRTQGYKGMREKKREGGEEE